MKPLARRYVEWRSGSLLNDQEQGVDPDAAWNALGRHWRAKALFAWSLTLLVLVLWLVVLTFLTMHWPSDAFRRLVDPYFYAAMVWGSVPPSIYVAGRMKDRRKQLKPSPFFFWFDR